MSGDGREVPLEIGERSAHHRVGDQAAYRPGNEARGIDPQLEYGTRPSFSERDEAPFTGEVAEVAAEIFAGDPVWLVVDLAQAVAHMLDARIALVLHDAPASALVALVDLHAAHGALPLREALVVGHGVEAFPRGRVDLHRLALAVVGHVLGLPEPGDLLGPLRSVVGSCGVAWGYPGGPEGRDAWRVRVRRPDDDRSPFAPGT
jgi:hypothetical protein